MTLNLGRFGCIRILAPFLSAAAGSVFALGLPLVSTSALAQQSTNRVEGLRDNTPRLHAITGARIVIAPGRVIERGTLVMKDGRITAVGADVPIPAGARVWKLDGRSVYAGFIDLASAVGVPASMRPAAPATPPWMRQAAGMAANAPSPTPAAATVRNAIGAQNRNVRADADVATQLDVRAEDAKALREQGFTTVLAVPAVGVFRGQSALVQLIDGVDARAQVLQPRVAQHMGFDFERGFGPNATYPNSMMGAIALARQSLYDARWYANAGKSGERAETNAALEALQAAISGKQSVVVHAESEQDYQRVARIRDEFGLRVTLLGNGYEYRRAAQLKQLGMPVIVPLNFPQAPEVENPDTAIDVALETLQHWEQAPSNPAYLERAGVTFALSTVGMRDTKEWLPQLRQAVKRGLSADTALAAVTTTPARWLGNAQLGTLEIGKLANVTVASADLFTNDTAEVEVTFVEGKPHVAEAYQRFDARGTWKVSITGATDIAREWKVAGTRARPTLTIDGQSCEIAVRARQVIASLPCRRVSAPGAAAGAAPAADAAASAERPAQAERQTFIAEAVGEGNNQLRGTMQTASGANITWTATRVAPYTETTARPRTEEAPAALPTTYPYGAYGVSASSLPRPASVLIKNATIWTGGAAGRMARADMLVRDGKIAALGSNLNAPADALVIDAAGKHVTPGIIDAHSHTAVIGGVNESTSSITAEVRIGDVIDATDINIYRQLAGGVTAVNVLHGSANTIGGQNQVLKFRWGSEAEGLKLAGAMPGIKFALGENVKQSNWQGESGTRYPQTRMGVEQILRDGFSAARQYQKRWQEHRANPKAVPEPRRDLQLDTLVEILEKKRVVHIHSYRADEILMFVRVAQEYGFTVATFQHVLEGYKVADAMAAINAGGSTFSDWWAYKMEVYDAIPTNAALMQQAGVLTTLNSDSNELARRLNTEAAKVVRYGGARGVSEEDALKMVTTNAAKQLRIDDRTGSLEVGKDADFVIWSASPLSTGVRAEQTWIEGRRYFDVQTDRELRAQAAAERQRLLAKALPARMARLVGPPGSGAGAGGGAGMGGRPPSEGEFSFVRDTLEYMAMQRWLHEAKQTRHSYWDGGAWHECTEDAK
ncbi:MAG: amidohydrolase family protein [Burkholderiales bacterium]|jgi:imidazolonepropionase-like amidohydrolase|nr:amidohydrolase family protein [Nitrosomonadaceae bacterium]